MIAAYADINPVLPGLTISDGVHLAGDLRWSQAVSAGQVQNQPSPVVLPRPVAPIIVNVTDGSGTTSPMPIVQSSAIGPIGPGMILVSAQDSGSTTPSQQELQSSAQAALNDSLANAAANAQSNAPGTTPLITPASVSNWFSEQTLVGGYSNLEVVIVGGVALLVLGSLFSKKKGRR